ncbi:hypothetical protein AFCDBAGC_4769 [Methylobacterium cerastii]|uniref:Uncharacterized protein n=1 Tax=Methylobacterium cerastii TaxID=932741 RepID=A0ABQ4QP98_9HYPH|nr:hypothetical protein [Methylobacterium cerastii]GJD46884.1 hypothetical protein AFCDBAGC_4769 [Methylobacterium cerastii]
MTLLVAPTFRFDILIAGDLAVARQVCREHCIEARSCVSIEPIDIVYTGGLEAGVRVGLINYPRFPSSLHGLRDEAMALGERLLHALCQNSFSIVGPRGRPRRQSCLIGTSTILNQI